MVYAVTFRESDTALLPRMEAASSAWRLERMSSLRSDASRMRSLAAGLLLDYALKAEGYPPLGHISYGDHGKPLANGVHFSLTHCRGLAACALAQHPVGIDAEPLREFSPRLKKRAFTPQELEAASACANPKLRLTQLWTLKESLLKARGGGISEGLLNFAFDVGDSIVDGPPGYDYLLLTEIEGYSIAVSRQR